MGKISAITASCAEPRLSARRPTQACFQDKAPTRLSSWHGAPRPLPLFYLFVWAGLMRLPELCIAGHPWAPSASDAHTCLHCRTARAHGQRQRSVLNAREERGRRGRFNNNASWRAPGSFALFLTACVAVVKLAKLLSYSLLVRHCRKRSNRADARIEPCAKSFAQCAASRARGCPPTTMPADSLAARGRGSCARRRGTLYPPQAQPGHGVQPRKNVLGAR